MFNWPPMSQTNIGHEIFQVIKVIRRRKQINQLFQQLEPISITPQSDITQRFRNQLKVSWRKHTFQMVRRIENTKNDASKYRNWKDVSSTSMETNQRIQA